MSVIARSELAEVLGEKTLHVTDSQELAQEIAAYLLTENRTADLESLLRDIMQYRADKGIVEAVVVSAHELSERELAGVEALVRQEYPEAKDVVVLPEINPKVVGGLQLKLANQQLDLSVQSKLNNFKRLTAQERNT